MFKYILYTSTLIILLIVNFFFKKNSDINIENTLLVDKLTKFQKNIYLNEEINHYCIEKFIAQPSIHKVDNSFYARVVMHLSGELTTKDMLMIRKRLLKEVIFIMKTSDMKVFHLAGGLSPSFIYIRGVNENKYIADFKIKIYPSKFKTILEIEVLEGY